MLEWTYGEGMDSQRPEIVEFALLLTISKNEDGDFQVIPASDTKCFMQNVEFLQEQLADLSSIPNNRWALALSVLEYHSWVLTALPCYKMQQATNV